MHPCAMYIRMHHKFEVHRMLYDGYSPVDITADLYRRLHGLCGIETKILKYRHSIEQFRSLLEEKRSATEDINSLKFSINGHKVLMDLHYQIMTLYETISYLNTSITSIKHQIQYLNEYRLRLPITDIR